jgi:hypothetical protein
MEKVNAIIGDTVKGDEWAWAEMLQEDDGFKDASYPGCQFRVHLFNGVKLGVNIKTTGLPRWNGYRYQSRCKIEVPGDGEPSQSFGGILYHIESI